MNDISEKIIQTIKEAGIKPKPRWQFLLKRWLVWVAAAVSALIGSLAFSVILFELVNADWEILEYLPRTPLQHFLNTLPYLWIVIMALFVLLAYYNARHTKGGYKYHAYWFVIGSLALSLVLGGTVYCFGLAPQIHYFLNRQVPFYGVLMHDREQLLVQPERGLLAGEVTKELNKPQLFELEDFSGQSWIVVEATTYQPTIFSSEEGQLVRIIGDLQSANEHTFSAIRVMPFFVGPGEIRGRIHVMPFNAAPSPGVKSFGR
jgi:hypothetical protein